MITADIVFENLAQFIKHIRHLHKKRRRSVVKIRITRPIRTSPNHANRQIILEKTKSRCHICGGLIAAEDSWQADHVFPYAHGGEDSVDNYLPAHTNCNNYRRSFSSEEFQWIMKLGVWFRTQIELEDNKALELAEKFIKHEVRRHSRRRK